MLNLCVISTGGTIEKVYQEATGALANVETKIDRYFRLLRLPDLKVEITHLMNKDSLEMTDADRQVVLEVVQSAGSAVQ
jgi:L-asparaginase